MRRYGAAAVDEFNSGVIVAQDFAKPQARTGNESFSRSASR